MKNKKVLLTSLLVMLMVSCGGSGNQVSSNENNHVSEDNVSETTSTNSSGEIIQTNGKLSLKMFGGVYLNTTRTIYAMMENYNDEEIIWTSSNPSVVSVSPREGYTAECTLAAKSLGSATITATLASDPSCSVSKEFVIEEGEAMPADLFNQITGGVKLVSSDKCLSYDEDYNVTVDEDYDVTTIYEEKNPSDTDASNTNDAYQITILNKKTNKSQSVSYVKGTGGYVCTEYLNYNNEVKEEKILNEDEEGYKWNSSYYCNLWRNTELVTNECFRTFDGGKTYHYSSYYITPIYLMASMYLLDASPDGMYFVNNEDGLEVHVEIDPYSEYGDGIKYGRKIVSKLEDVGTATIDHIKPYEHKEEHDALDAAFDKMANLKNYKATLTLDYPSGSEDYVYDFIYTEDTVDVSIYANNKLYSRNGWHKDSDSSYFSYYYSNNQVTIDKKYNTAWDEVNKYPTFDVAAEVFSRTANNKYKTIDKQGLYVEYCTYMPSGSYYFSYDEYGYIELTDDGYISKITTSANALGERVSITVTYSDFENTTCDIDFSSIGESNLPTSFMDAEPALYNNLVEWNIEDIVPYLYSSVGYSTSVGYAKNDDYTGVKYAFIKTNTFDTADERDTFIAQYKDLLIANGFEATGEVHDETGYPLYKKGDYYVGIGINLSWNGTEQKSAKIIIVSELLEAVQIEVY